MRAWLALALCMPLMPLAGCSDSGGQAEGDAGPAGADGGPLGVVPTGAGNRTRFTDTLHFLGPAMTPVAPMPGSAPVLVPLDASLERFQDGDTTSHAMWFYTFAGRGTFVGAEVRFWIHVDHDLVNPAAAGGVTCPWAMWLELVDPEEELQFADRPCLMDANPVLAAGDHELVFAVSGSRSPIDDGWVLGIGLDVGPSDPAAPDAIQMITGTVEGTRVYVPGLREPIPGTGGQA